MIGMASVVIYDLDSTVADTRHRWHLTPRNNPSSDWEKYSLACTGDTVIAGTAKRMELDWYQHEVHICTGRSAAARELSSTWLDTHVGRFWDHLEMRPAGDTTANGLFKVQYIHRLREQGKRVELFYEDWEVSARDIETAGVPVLGINPFYPKPGDGSL